MNIMELGAIGELVGGVAVIATLLYLAGQVRQGRLEAKAASLQAMADSFSRVNFEISATPERSRVSRLGWVDFSSLNEDEQHVFSLEAMCVCHVFETVLLREELGIADPDTVEAVKKNIAGTFQLPGMRQWWTAKPPHFGLTQRLSRLVEASLAQSDGA